jgi:transposase
VIQGISARGRPAVARDSLRCTSDLTDDEWPLLAPLIPLAKRGGRRRFVDVREILNSLLYGLSAGC